MKSKEEMQKINTLLVKASNAYYMSSTPIMTDREYDTLYDEVVNWEKQTGITLDNSITQQVGAEVVSKLVKEPHEQKALSLNKTKNVDELVKWTKGQDVVLSWKLDGLTVVATYNEGSLTKAVTRGNGAIGENVTHNAKYFHGLPQTIPYKGHLVVRGEALISYPTFERINAGLAGQKYSVPRSLASGSVRQLDANVARKRGIEFKAFELVVPNTKTFYHNLAKLKELGFAVVPHKKVASNDLKKEILSKEEQVNKYQYPVDGLVVMIDDLDYAKKLGTTDKYPNWGMAFKWRDDVYQTTIRDIEWQASRTGRINPVCIFDTVEIDGSQVSRATGNNLSFLNDKGIGVGSVVEVYKANMIIPTIDRVVENPQPLSYPATCPSCGCPTTVRKGKDGSMFLMCENADCPAKHLEHFTHFVSRDALNIDGLAKNTLDMLVNQNVIHNFVDIYHIKEHPEIVGTEGFGQKSYDKLCQAIENSRKTTLDRVIYAMGIEGVGRRVSKDISKHCKGDLMAFVNAMNNGYDWRNVEGVGDVLNTSLHKWWLTGNNSYMFVSLCSELHLEKPKTQNAKNTQPNGISGKTFCVTGKVYQFANRNALGQWIEEHGGKLSSSVSSKTDYLVNNDATSTSGKNKKAHDLGIPILTEDDLLKLA